MSPIPPGWSPPSPPSPPRRNHWRTTTFVLLAVIILETIAFGVYQPGKQQLPFSLSLPTLAPTSTLTAAQSLHTKDFSNFIQSFSQLFVQKDFATLQSVVDKDRFVAENIRPDPYLNGAYSIGPLNWQDTNRALVTEQLYFRVSSPPLTADQAGYSCFGYNQTGVSFLGINVDAQALQYIAGTLIVPRFPAADPQPATNGTVFMFELPKGSSSTWLWRAAFFDNVLGCN